MQSAAAVARAAGVQSWRFAYQSAGKTPTPWLGPDILEAIETIAGEGRTQILCVPFGFVCDHLEILYDIDIEAMAKAAELGVNLSRIEMPNDDPRVRRGAARPGGERNRREDLRAQRVARFHSLDANWQSVGFYLRGFWQI